MSENEIQNPEARTPDNRVTINLHPFKDRYAVYKQIAKILKRNGVLQNIGVGSFMIACTELVINLSKSRCQLPSIETPDKLYRALHRLEAKHATAISKKKRGPKSKKKVSRELLDS